MTAGAPSQFFGGSIANVSLYPTALSVPVLDQTPIPLP